MFEVFRNLRGKDICGKIIHSLAWEVLQQLRFVKESQINLQGSNDVVLMESFTD